MPALATLDDLSRLGPAALEALYRAARPPALAELSGDLVGRMLAFSSLRARWLVRALRAFAAWRWFPWRGKSFSHDGGPTGVGINRVFSDVTPRRWFRFATRVAPSRTGVGQALELDYDNPANPFYIRAIKDEIREVRPGLWLGQARLVTRKRARLVLYFALAIR